jgi:hypothetical protein
VYGLPFAVTLREVMPVGARTQHPQNRVDEPTIILRRPPRVIRFAWAKARKSAPTVRRLAHTA